MKWRSLQRRKALAVLARRRAGRLRTTAVATRTLRRGAAIPLPPDSKK